MEDFTEKPNPPEALKKNKVPMEELPKEELLKHAKKYLALLQTAKTKYSELSAKCSSLEEERDGAFVILAELKKRYQVDSIGELQNKVDSLETKIHRLNENNEELMYQLEDSNNGKHSLLKEKHETSEKLQCLELQVDTLRKTSKCLQEECVKLANHNQALERQVQIVTDERENIEKSLRSISKDLESVKSFAKTQTKELGDLLEEKQSLETKIGQVECSFLQAQEESRSLQETLAKIKADAEYLKNDKLLDSDNTLNTYAFNQTKREFEEIQIALESKFEKAKEEFIKDKADLESSINETKTKNEELFEERVKLQDDVVALESKVSALEIKLNESNLLNEELSQHKIMLQDNLESKISALAIDLNESKSKNEKLSSEKAELRDNSMSLESEISELKSKIMVCKAIENESVDNKTKLVNEVTDLQSKISVLEFNLNDSKTLIEELSKYKTEFQDNVPVLKSKITTLELNLAELTAINEKLLNENSSLLDSVTVFESKISTLELSLSEYKLTNDELLEKKSKLQNDTSALESKLTTISENLNSMTNERSLLISELKSRNLYDSESELSMIDLFQTMNQTSKSQQLKCEELQKEISNLTDQLENETQKLTNLEQKHDGSTEKKLNQLLEQQKSDLKEIESLKQQLDEYENDIQKHLALEKENYELQSSLDELEQEYFKLSEQLEFKCSELNDTSFHLDSLIMELRQEVQKFIKDIPSENKGTSDIFVLKTLCEKLCLELSKMTALKAMVENTAKDKEAACKELEQVQDLKQFLEDEVTELREEVNLLKSSVVDKHDVSTEYHYDPISCEVSEWGLAAVPISCDLESKVANLQSQLDAKSILVESIHCEMDLLMSKVEELTTELAEKNSELTAVQQSKMSVIGTIKEIGKMSSLLVNLREDTSSHLDEFQLYCSHFQEKTHEALLEILSRYRDSEALLQSYKSTNDCFKVDCSKVLKEVLSIMEFLEANKMKFIPVNQTVSFPNQFDSENVVNDLTMHVCQLKKILTFISNLPPLEKMSETKFEPLQNNTERSPCIHCQQLKNDLAEVELRSLKLKAVAMKIKKELNESNKKCHALLEERNRKQHQIEELSEDVTRYVQNFQNLQSEYDKLQDECEALKTSNRKFHEDLASKLEELENYKKKLLDIEMGMKKTSESLVTGQTEKTELKDKVTELESKLIVSDSKLNDSQSIIQGLKEELNKIQQVVKSLQGDKLELSKQIEDASMNTQHESLLNLEMADYERTISELNESLEKKNVDITDFQCEIETFVARIQSLEDDVQFCESHRKTEEKRAEGFKKALDNCKKELSVLRESESKLKNDVSSLTLKLETLGLEDQEYKSQLGQQSAELMQMKEMLRTSNENHQRIVQSLNSKLLTQKHDILLANKEVESVKQDFENYKIRVHSVLKQQKTVSAFTLDDAEVKEKLEGQNEKLKLKLKELGEKLEANKLENELLQEEYDHLLQRHGKVVEELEAKDRSWSQRFEEIVDEKNKLQALLEKSTSEHSLKNEMLVSSYKKQIKILHDNNKHALAELQKQLESADIEISRLHREHQRCNISLSSSTVTQDDNFNVFDISSVERQEGEGSECTEDGATPIHHLSLATIPTPGFLPLEKLLQSPIESYSPTSTMSNQDSERLSAELNSSWKKIDHLSELLNESEANNLRLSEQVRVLKEEFRRQERNLQRGEHAENLEYLKNVVVKFATLESGDEKARLIPVLNMILKLSPVELEQLKKTAGGTELIDTSSNTWGSYLHRWSGLA